MIKFRATLNNSLLNLVESTIGTAPKLRILTGAPEATPETAQAGTQIVQITLPSDWMSNANANLKAKSGIWAGKATAAGTAGHFRILNSAATVCYMVGSITGTGGGGDITTADPVILLDKWVVIDQFDFTGLNI